MHVHVHYEGFLRKIYRLRSSFINHFKLSINMLREDEEDRIVHVGRRKGAHTPSPSTESPTERKSPDVYISV